MKVVKKFFLAVSITALLGVTSGGISAFASFSDVPNRTSSNYYFHSINWMEENGIVEGYSDGTFRPNNKINFAEAMKIVAKAFFDVDGMYGEGDNYNFCMSDFSEYYASQWYWKYFYVVDSNCLIPDYLNGMRGFVPGQDVTRADMAELLYRAKIVRDKNANAGNDVSDFEKYMEGDVPSDIIFKFDSCGELSEYMSYPWFEDLDAKYIDEFLTPQGLSGHVYDENVVTQGDACLSLGGEIFIFIPAYSEFGCGRIMKYVPSLDTLHTTFGQYCATEFGSRVGDYVEFTGAEGDDICLTRHNGKYYFMQDRAESETYIDCGE